MRLAPTFELSFETRLELEKLLRRRSTPMRVVQLNRIMLLAAGRMQNKHIAEQLSAAPAWFGARCAESFKVSNNPHIGEKLYAIVGLYLDPPEHAPV
jgi:hypothetical protein